MAELITGRGGTDHVDSEDFGAFNAVTLGDGTYILSGCSMAMKTASKLHIAAGELLMQGRHVRIKGAGEDIDVAVGTTGYNRNDLVALHYKQEGGIESVSVEVVAGTPTTGAASDPELGGGSILNGDAEAYVAIARVPIVGLAPSAPVVLAENLPTLKSLGDSVSQVQYYSTTSTSFTFIPKVSGVIIAQVWVCKTYGAWGGEIGLHIDVPSGLKEEASVSTAITGNDGVYRSMTAKAVLSGAVAGKSYNFSSSLDPNSGYALSTPRAWMLEVRPY